LLSHFPSSGVRDYQLVPHEHYSSSSLEIRRAHWGIETGLHYRRDVTFKEDATRMTIGHTGHVMASINNLIIALTRQAKFRNTAQARRWFAAHISDAFSLLTRPYSLLEKTIRSIHDSIHVSTECAYNPS